MSTENEKKIEELGEKILKLEDRISRLEATNEKLFINITTYETQTLNEIDDAMSLAKKEFYNV